MTDKQRFRTSAFNSFSLKSTRSVAHVRQAHKHGKYAGAKRINNDNRVVMLLHECSHWRNKQDKNRHTKKEYVSLSCSCACAYFMYVLRLRLVSSSCAYSYFTSVNRA